MIGTGALTTRSESSEGAPAIASIYDHAIAERPDGSVQEAPATASLDGLAHEEISVLRGRLL